MCDPTLRDISIRASNLCAFLTLSDPLLLRYPGTCLFYYWFYAAPELSTDQGMVVLCLGALVLWNSGIRNSKDIFRFQENPAVNDSKPQQLAIGQMLEFAAARIWQRPVDPRWIHSGHSPKMWSFADLKSYPKWLQVSLDFRWWSCIRVTGTTSGCLGLPRCCSRKLPFT